jgi:hypothetical protein
MKGVVLAAVVCLGAVPQIAQAQACFGVPSADRQTAIAGVLGFTEGSKSYGANLNANLAGPLSVGAGYSLVDIDDVSTRGHSFGAGAGYELKVPNFSVCPTVRVNYSRAHEEDAGLEATVSELVVPIGVGIGKQFAAGTSSFITLFGEPQFLYIKDKFEVENDNLGLSFDEDDTAFGANLGITFGTSSYYVGGSVQLTSIEDSDPVFNISVGVLLGGKK